MELFATTPTQYILCEVTSQGSVASYQPVSPCTHHMPSPLAGLEPGRACGEWSCTMALEGSRAVHATAYRAGAVT